MMERDTEKPGISPAVQGFWLQYRGLTIGSPRARYGVDNAAYTITGPVQAEDLPEPGAFMVAT